VGDVCRVAFIGSLILFEKSIIGRIESVKGCRSSEIKNGQNSMLGWEKTGNLITFK
jgi:hypothetical protein